jgi:hypothetical protein
MRTALIAALLLCGECKAFFVAPGAVLVRIGVACHPKPLHASECFAHGEYSDGKRESFTTDAIWSSSNPGVATVEVRSGGAWVTHLARGETEIRATFQGLSGETRLTVAP